MTLCRAAIALTTLTAAAALEIRPAPPKCDPVPGEARNWDTRRFRMISEIDLSEPDRRRLAVVADSTANAVEVYPVDWYAPPENHRPELRIYRGAASYEKAGATAGSAGWYLWKDGALALNAEHLFPPNRGSSRLRPLPDEAIVVHEVVHLCMHRSQGRLPQWFSEGLCEYFAAAHQGGGKFDFRSMDRSIREHLQSRFGKAAEVIPALAIGSIADLDHREWTRFMLRLPAEERYHGYVTGLLLAHYYLHAGPRREAIVKCFETHPPVAPKSFARLKAEGDEIQKALTRYWTSRGLALEFADSADPVEKP